jgi:O-antigen/teichoic acid export membrane protein
MTSISPSIGDEPGSTASTTGSSADLRSKVVSGLGWKLFSQVVAVGSRFVLAIVLAHFLTPHELGLAGMALVFTGFANIFADLSLGAALVQRTTISSDDLSTAFWTNLAAGAALWALGVGLAPYVAHFFSTPAVTPLFEASASLAFLYSLIVTQTAVLTREMDFRSLEIRTIFSTLAGGAVAVSLAATGFGAWAIVGQAICTAVVSAALLWSLSSWRPTAAYSLASLRTLGSFGGQTVFSRILSYASLNADNLLIGRYIGSAGLGIYSIAYTVMFTPLQQIAQPVQQVLFPAFAKVKADTERLGQAWLRGNQLVGALLVPALLGMAVVAPDFVPTVFGPRWHASIPVLQLLCLAGVAESFKMLNWSMLQATGQTGRLLRFMSFSTAITLAAFVGGLTWGVVGVAGLFAVARTITLVVYTWTTCRTIELPISRFARLVAWVLSSALPMTACLLGGRALLVHEHVPAATRLAVLIVVGAAVYVATIALRDPTMIKDARALVRNRLPGASRPRR